MALISYAQNFEDVMLSRALKDVRNGFYIDIGAHDPVIDSVSRGFYEQGWRGVHIEPLPVMAQALRDNRPDETVLQVALSSQTGTMRLYDVAHTGLSTGIADIASRYTDFETHEITVPVITLADLFDQIGAKDIHWLKIDVEGMEKDVLQGWASHKARPWIIVIESTLPRTQVENYSEWENELLERNYTFVYFDGLNRYYLSEEQKDRARFFNTPPNVFDDFHLSGRATSNMTHMLQQSINLLSQKQEAALEQAAALQKTLQAKEEHFTVEVERLNADIRTITNAAQDNEAALNKKWEIQYNKAQQDGAAREKELDDRWKQYHAASIKAVEEQAKKDLAARENILHEAMEKQKKQADGLASMLRGQIASANTKLDEMQLAHKTEVESLRSKAQAIQDTYTQQVNTLHHELAEKQAELARKNEDIVRKQQENESRQEIIRGLEARLHGTEKELAEKLKTINHLSAQLWAAQDAFLSIKNSFLWKITRPLRGLGAIFTGKNTKTIIDMPIFENNSILYETIMQTMPQQDGSLSSLLTLYDAPLVIAAYRAFLDREPDTGGLEHYLEQLRTGHSRMDVLAQIAVSKESLAGNRIDTKTLGFLKAHHKRTRSRWRKLFSNSDILALQHQIAMIEGQIYSLGHKIGKGVPHAGTINPSVTKTEILQTYDFESISVADLRKQYCSQDIFALPSSTSNQLLVDVSELVLRDARTGIQRVVRSIAQEILATPPKGYTIRFVAAIDGKPYHYVLPLFLDGFRPFHEIAMGEVKVNEGDIFFALDLLYDRLQKYETTIAAWKDAGLRFFPLVYDILPAQYPEWFNETASCLFKRWIRTLLSFSDQIIAISEATKNDLIHFAQQEFGLAPDSFTVQVMPLGSDVEKSIPSMGLNAQDNAALKKIKTSQAILSVGTIEPRKGIDDALAAFEILWKKGNDITYVIIGKPGWNMEKFHNKLRNHPEQGKRLFWLEKASDECLLKAYDLCKGVLMCSKGEGLGLPLQEALRHNKPVLARDIPVFHEQDDWRVTYFKTSKPEDLAKAIALWEKSGFSSGKEKPASNVQVTTWEHSARFLRQRVFTLPQPFKKLDDFLRCKEETFLKAAYITFLGRSPDQDGYNYFALKLANGMPRTQLLEELAYSPESLHKQIFPKSLLMEINPKRAAGLFGPTLSEIDNVLNILKETARKAA
ncbi:MAG: FkbM family methyltransferase [Micavibrio sp.]